MSICTAPIYKLDELNNLFIEMTSKSCNQRCSGCYIDFPLSKKVKDFITIDKVKEVIEDSLTENLYCIYLTGAEPMTHPDFNSILRLCLKRCNVCICTNASFLNEKKIRFLKKVEDEGCTQIFFQLSAAHYDEKENDKVRYRGSFRQTIASLKILSRYNFESVLCIQNYYNLDNKEIYENLNSLFQMHEIKNTDIKITASYPIANEENLSKISPKTDCMRGRSVTQNGIYACPFLANDYRGRVGSSLKNYAVTVSAETDFCATCSANGDSIFAIG